MPTTLLPLRRNPFFKSADGVDTALLYKASNEPLVIDWSDSLSPGETIAASSWTYPGMSLTTFAIDAANNKTSAIIADGFGEVTNRITTSTGRTPSVKYRFRDRDRCSGTRDYEL